MESKKGGEGEGEEGTGRWRKDKEMSHWEKVWLFFLDIVIRLYGKLNQNVFQQNMPHCCFLDNKSHGEPI
jgi:hypothetical protein